MALFRADAIVADCELVRRALFGEAGRWTLLAQSYGGFVALRYLSVAPHAVDVALFAQLVDLKDRVPGSIKQPYDEIYANVRRAVDLCHCDGEIKDPVAVDPAKYIKPSPHLARMLSQLRAGGTKASGRPPPPPRPDAPGPKKKGE